MIKNSYRLPLCAALSSLALLTACNEEKKVEVDSFESAESCANSGRYTAAQCEESFKKAATAHTQSAPRYETILDCEKDFGAGNCGIQNNNAASTPVAPESSSSQESSSFIMPFIIGYIIGNMTGNSGSSTLTPAAAPLYRQPSGGLVTPDGTRFNGDLNGRALVSPEALRPQRLETFARGTSATSTRGGFGSTAARHSVGSTAARHSVGG